jgi:alanine dehydrogenase
MAAAKLTIGVPRERKTLEQRVALTPDGAAELVKHGHTVLIETNAGQKSHFEDAQYTQAGCKIVPTLAEVWNSSNMVVKVKEPHEEEFQYFRKDLILFDYLHLASMPDVTKAMLDGQITGIAYELVKTAEGRLPLLEPMSEVAGKLSVLNGSYFLLGQNGGRGVLLGGTVGVLPAKVVIVGAGIAGRCACEVALGMGADVSVLDVNYTKLDHIRVQTGGRARTVHSTKASLEREVQTADLLIGAVLIPGAAAPKLITRDMIRSMKKGSVFVDISIDQGGCGETIKPTNLDAPTFVEDGVIHYGVCNMPAQTPRTSTQALTAATLPYVLKIANHGGLAALDTFAELRGALNTHHGMLTNHEVSEATGFRYSSIEEALKKK